jgi:limonene-1,2-epoxide hydrolase
MQPLDVVNHWNDAWNSGDVRNVAACYAEDVVYQHSMLPEPLNGRDAVLEFISGIGSAFSSVDDAVVHAVQNGDEVAAEVRHRARHTGDLPTPMSVLSATDRTVELVAAHFFRVNDAGLIVEERMYSNPMDMMAQLGATPTPG